MIEVSSVNNCVLADASKDVCGYQVVLMRTIGVLLLACGCHNVNID